MGDGSFRAPDSIILKSGQTVDGLIVKNTAREVVLQQEFREVEYPKNQIVRIRDEADTETIFMDSPERGMLPSWRVIANDLRLTDAIYSMVEIPATRIDKGVFRNVPYLSFRVNEDVELNIYGDPNKPAGIELGIYGHFLSHDKELRQVLRAYLAGFLAARDEVAALYRVPLSGGIKRAGDLDFEITPSSAPDAYGAWWVSIYNRKRLETTRLDDADYNKLAKPMSEVVDHKGRVLGSVWSAQAMAMAKRRGDTSEVLSRGFYRDREGQFRLLGPATGE